MKYVLDTNAVSALMRGDAAMLDRLRKTEKTDVGLPGPVSAEIAYGIERLPNSKRKRFLSDQYHLILATVDRQPWTDEVSLQFGKVKAALEKSGRMIEDFDAAIAAHALAMNAILITNNTVQMARVPGLVVEDWSRPEGVNGEG